MVLPAAGAEIKPAQYEHCKGIDVLGCPADCYVCLENGADDDVLSCKKTEKYR